VAVVDRNNIPVTRKEVLKARGAFQLKNIRGQIIAASWPRKRGPVTSVFQGVWVEHFKCLAFLTKVPEGRSFAQAQEWAKGTGWYYRDVFSAAAVGKLLVEPGQVRVTTPTVYLQRTSVEALVANVTEEVTWETPRWDNNSFWSASTNPKRITARSAGLYLIGAAGNFNNQASDGSRAISIRINGTTVVESTRNQDIANQDLILNVSTIWYLDQNDYVEIQVVTTISTDLNNARAWLVGITPEAITQNP